MSNELVSASLKAKKVTLAGGRTGGAYVEEYEAVGGLTIRDYFAARAMHAQLSQIDSDGFDVNYKLIASDAYLAADAMIEARTKL